MREAGRTILCDADKSNQDDNGMVIYSAAVILHGGHSDLEHLISVVDYNRTDCTRFCACYF